MRPKILLLFLILFAAFVTASVTFTINDPEPYKEQTSTSMTFSWTPVYSSGDIYPMAYLYLSNPANDTTVLNKSLNCNGNDTECNSTITGLTAGWYSWYVAQADSGNNATVTGSEVGPFDFILSEAVANKVGNQSEVFNLSDYYLLMTYTVDSVEEQCSVIFSGTDNLTAASIATNITTASTNITYGADCNVTAADNGNGNLSLSTTGTGNDEYLNVSGNATDVLGLTVARALGTQENNNSLTIEYTVNGTAETCGITFTLSNSESISNVMSNVTLAAACNLTASNSSEALNLTTNGKGADEYINITGGNASGVLGLSIGATLGTETLTNTNLYWFEIKETTYNVTHIVLANDTYIEGSLNVSGYASMNELFIVNPPVACSSSFGMNRFTGNTSSCTHFMLGTGDAVVGNYNITGNLNISGNLNVSNIYVSGCFNYNCTGSSGCIKLGDCI